MERRGVARHQQRRTVEQRNPVVTTDLAQAITAHQSNGSEANAVIDNFLAMSKPQH
jgi:hypothetical protein